MVTVNKIKLKVDYQFINIPHPRFPGVPTYLLWLPISWSLMDEGRQRKSVLVQP